jgi:hypothetical protein
MLIISVDCPESSSTALAAAAGAAWLIYSRALVTNSKIILLQLP